jgi:hypothetical protein
MAKSSFQDGMNRLYVFSKELPASEPIHRAMLFHVE